MIDGGDASLPGESGDQDIVNAGDDELNGRAGDDLLAGDRDTTDNLEGGREVFRWSEATDPDGADGTPGIDDGDALGGFTLNTGSVDVTFSTTSTGANNSTVFADNFHLVTGIVDDGSGVDANSSLDNVANGEGNAAEFALDFSNPVENVSFRINDVDADGVVTVTAIGPDGPITVNLTAGANVTLLDNDAVPGAETADSNGGNEDDSSPNYSVLVDIPGPVSQIVVTHAQDGPANSGIKLTDVYFDAAPVVAVGDDTLNGEEGDDILIGEGGDDVLTGGEGADDIQGGDDADLIIGANGGDTIDGGSGGDDDDTLDLRDSGPLNIVDQEVDPDGNSTSGTIEFLDPVTGAVTGISNFSEIENLLLPEANTDPVAVNDSITTAPGVAVDISVLENDDDADGDTLTVFNASDGDNGTVVNNGDGTVTYTPNAGFTGTDSFFYDISDGRGGIDSAEVFVTISDDPVPPTGPDGIVSGTAAGEVIDLGYTGDPDGDTIDANDAILPGEGPQDDIVEAGGGDDTVRGREGDDDIDGGDGDDSLRGDAGDDSLDGGDGDDTLRGDAGDNTLVGGDGDDSLIGGPGVDSIIGGDGQDTALGGGGDDFIDTSAPVGLPGTPGFPLPDDGFDGTPFVPADTDPDNDRDLVAGGAGNDTIFTGDDADTITGGAGDDVIDGGLDDDDIAGGAGNDEIIAGEGSDTVFGGDGDDTIFGGINGPGVNIPDAIDPELDNGDDFLDGGAGDDLIFGEDDNDTILGGIGNDTLDGGIDDDFIRGQDGDDSILGGGGDDSLRGGNGDDIIEGGDGDDTIEGRADNDTIIGGAGADDMSGDTGRDTFIIGSSDDGNGDNADGGSGGDDFDTLDLTGAGDFEITDRTVDPDGNSISGTLNFLDPAGTITGTMTFQEIVRIIPCFTPGTKIATPQGERLVEDLEVGDKVITRDNGLQEIRWVGRRDLEGRELLQAPQMKPVLIRAGALGRSLPETDLLVSPNHRVLINNEKSALYFEDREVLVAAKHLTDLEGVDAVDTDAVT